MEQGEKSMAVKPGFSRKKISPRGKCTKGEAIMAAKKETEYITHAFEPVFDSHSKILMLGTMPSPKSRENGFYYGHPRNRFWKVIADVCKEPMLETIEEKKALALKHGIAIWDVLAGCEIHGADDASIKNPTPNDMHRILDYAPIEQIYATGTKAAQLYRRYCEAQTGMEIIQLPSTSPANCRTSYEQLYEAYAGIRLYLRSDIYDKRRKSQPFNSIFKK